MTAQPCINARIEKLARLMKTAALTVPTNGFHGRRVVGLQASVVIYCG